MARSWRSRYQISVPALNTPTTVDDSRRNSAVFGDLGVGGVNFGAEVQGMMVQSDDVLHRLCADTAVQTLQGSSSCSLLNISSFQSAL